MAASRKFDGNEFAEFARDGVWEKNSGWPWGWKAQKAAGCLFLGIEEMVMFSDFIVDILLLLLLFLFGGVIFFGAQWVLLAGEELRGFPREFGIKGSLKMGILSSPSCVSPSWG